MFTKHGFFEDIESVEVSKEAIESIDMLMQKEAIEK